MISVLTLYIINKKIPMNINIWTAEISVAFQIIICLYMYVTIRVITKLPNFEQSYKGKVKTHKYINRQNQSTTGKL